MYKTPKEYHYGPALVALLALALLALLWLQRVQVRSEENEDASDPVLQRERISKVEDGQDERYEFAKCDDKGGGQRIGRADQGEHAPAADPLRRNVSEQVTPQRRKAPAAVHVNTTRRLGEDVDMNEYICKINREDFSARGVCASILTWQNKNKER